MNTNAKIGAAILAAYALLKLCRQLGIDPTRLLAIVEKAS